MVLPFLVIFLSLPLPIFAQGRQPAASQKPYVVESAPSFRFRSVEDDHGGFYLVWQRQQQSQILLMAQHVGVKGQTLWAEPGISLISGLAPQANWDAVADTGGGLLLAFERGSHVSAQRVSQEGKLLWSGKHEIVSESTATQRSPTLAPDGSGGAFVVWEERLPVFPERWVLLAQHLNALGAPLWTSQATRVSLRPSDQRRPRVVYDGSAGVMIAWKDFRESASQLQVQRLNYQGNRLWGLQGLLITAPAGDPARAPYLGAVGRGSAVLAWQASSAAADRIFLQLVNASGQLNWGPQGVELDQGNWHQWNPVLHGDGQGGTWVGWEDYRNNLNWVIYVKHLDVGGHSGWPTPEVTLTNVQADQGRLGLTDDGRGGILAAWVDNRNGTVGIYLQEINDRGETLLGAEGLTVATQLVDPETRPQVVSLAPGEVAVVGSDTPMKGVWKLYWQRIGPLQPLR